LKKCITITSSFGRKRQQREIHRQTNWNKQDKEKNAVINRTLDIISKLVGVESHCGLE
jgi:hypothetical protein